MVERDCKHTEKEVKDVAQLAAWVNVVPGKCDIFIEATLILENCKKYKEVHGKFPGKRDCALGRKLQNLKQIVAKNMEWEMEDWTT